MTVILSQLNMCMCFPIAVPDPLNICCDGPPAGSVALNWTCPHLNISRGRPDDTITHFLVQITSAVGKSCGQTFRLDPVGYAIDTSNAGKWTVPHALISSKMDCLQNESYVSLAGCNSFGCGKMTDECAEMGSCEPYYGSGGEIMSAAMTILPSGLTCGLCWVALPTDLDFVTFLQLQCSDQFSYNFMKKMKKNPAHCERGAEPVGNISLVCWHG